MSKAFKWGLRDSSWSQRNAAMMQLWKFEADLYSKADVIAFMDDDACLIDHILPSEIINIQGQLQRLAHKCLLYVA